MGNINLVLLPILALIGGSIMLYLGAEGLVRGSSSLALRKGISSLVVGLTIVAFGTSSPEFVVSITSALKGNSAIAFGNIVGSNICNIALILGVAAIITPIKVNIRLIKSDIIIMIAVTILLIFLILDKNLGQLDGLILLVGIIWYVFFTLYTAKKDRKKLDLELPKEVRGRTIKDIFFIVFGVTLLVIGANLFIDGAIKIAKFLEVSDVVIGLSVVAVGTSLPELATSIVAAVKKEADISIGNIVGSNIFNILGILGIASLLHPISLTGANSINIVDIAVMIIVSVILLPLAYTKLTMSRLEGLFLFFLYIAYIFYMYFYRIQEFSYF
ncbi:sodium:calcium antiporter [Bacteroidetes/Chlorobi group bacterium ChocPot_Mid]|nr:MAG: sodium:calcium antiporter [Bacteroidetes/Chlorobi group bacterium ChocPot_Mid]